MYLSAATIAQQLGGSLTCLAAAGLGDADQVPACGNHRPTLALRGGGACVACGLEGPPQRRSKGCLLEGHPWLGHRVDAGDLSEVQSRKGSRGNQPPVTSTRGFSTHKEATAQSATASSGQKPEQRGRWSAPSCYETCETPPRSGAEFPPRPSAGRRPPPRRPSSPSWGREATGREQRRQAASCASLPTAPPSSPSVTMLICPPCFP